MIQFRKSHLFIGDVVILYGGLFLTLMLRYGLSTFTDLNILPDHLTAFSIIFAFWLIVFYIANIYEFSITRNNLEFFSAYTWAFIINALSAILFFYFIPFFDIAPKTNLFIFVGISGTLLASWRYYFNHLLKKSGFRHNIVIVGRNQQSQELYDFIKDHDQLGNVLDIVEIGKVRDHQALATFIRDYRVRTVILTPEAYNIPRLIETLYRLGRKEIRFFNLPDYFERITGKVPLGVIDQSWFLQYLSGEEAVVLDIGKRMIDLVFSLIVGLITLPLYPVIMAMIKLSSPGPVFYKQNRVGKAGQIFTLYKFRTMIRDAEKYGALMSDVRSADQDPRITGIGQLLRKTRLDELPQIWNIIKGEVSVVGPRPERPEFHEDLKEKIPFYEERYIVKPGMTGWAQVKFKVDFENGLTVADTAEKLKYDLYYIKHRSALFDIAIILKTINILIKKLFF